MSRTIENLAVVLTGASSGIGRATAIALAREGARLFLVARRRDRLEQLQAEIQKKDRVAFIEVLDLRNADAVHAMIRSGFEKLGRIDVLINNAGFGYRGTVEKTPHAIVREIFEVNFEAPLIASQDVIPIMRRQGGGHIINISSIAGHRGIPLSGIYCATKFALNGLSEALRIELKGSNILVSLISPASTESEFWSALRKGDVDASQTQAFKPIGREQTSQDVAEAIVRCVRNPKIEIYPYWPSRFVATLNAIAPSLVDSGTYRFLRNRLRAIR
jgi:short-subunit dehydrogenase